MPHSARSGFTFIEGLIAVAIVALFLGLLLPAMQKVRAAAARVSCSNNLREMGTAFQSHHDALGRFPWGGTHFEHPSPWTASADVSATTPQAREASWSWAYQVLPYMHQSELFQNPDSHAVQAAAIKAYYCPARRPVGTFIGMAKIDYAGNAGTHPEGQNGIVMRSTQGFVRASDVSDGLRSTLLVGEKQLNAATLGSSLDDNEAYCTPGWNGDWEVYRVGTERPAPDRNVPGNTDPSQVFGGPHPGGFQCAFADGSVRFVRYSVSPGTWQRVCGRNDNLGFNNNEL